MIITESVDATLGVLANFDLTFGFVKNPLELTRKLMRWIKGSVI